MLMAIGRQGIWKCPECRHHQTWKTRSRDSIKLDRKCEKCSERARVTIDRSESGKGRGRKVEIWERTLSISPEDLLEEADRRNSDSGNGIYGFNGQHPSSSDYGSPADLPPIWGAGWWPEKALDFTTPIDQKMARGDLLCFVAERHDGYLGLVSDCWDSIGNENRLGGTEFHEFSGILLKSIENRLSERLLDPKFAPLIRGEIIPMRKGELYLGRRGARFLIDLALCLRRIAYYASITMEQRNDWQRWMTRTRLVDEQLKELFSNGLPTPDGGNFGGKGFRSTWQEGIVACASSLRRSIDLSPADRKRGDIVAPMIRDVGLAIAMGQTPIEIFSAQMGKSDSYMDGGIPGCGGRDLHIGNWEKGVLPPTAPLPIASATTTGIALAAKRLGIDRFHLAPVGEGCSSSGEFWEAMNFAGARGLPICYMIQNNQIALDTFASGQSGAETFGDKGHAMGLPSWTIDGSDPAMFYCSTSVAREFAIDGGGATLIHVETMRGCGHAHHHDDLYLGASSGNPPGYVDRGLLEYWAEKDPVPNHRELLIQLGTDEGEIRKMEESEEAEVERARTEVGEMEWPEGHTVTRGVTSLHDASTHEQQLSRIESGSNKQDPTLKPGEISIEFSDSPKSWTYSKAIQNGMAALAENYGDEVVFMGEDMEIAGAFGMNLPLKARGHQDKLLDMPLSESIIVHSATGAALGGMRPMAEIQFGGFAALAMNPIVNNAAQLRWRWGAEVPMTIRIPLGAKTRSGPFHANMIESWFSNDPGLVIVAPSIPQDAYDLLVESHALPDPVIYLEHIGLYGLRGGNTGWGTSINQIVDERTVHENLSQGLSSIGKARVVRGGRDLTIVTWGAMVHVALEAAKISANNGVEVEVIDLRTIIPMDSETCVNSVLRTGKLLVLQEAQWTGGMGHTVSSRIIEEAFWSLEAPPVVIGALDTPVPFSPTLEDHTVPKAALVARHVERACLN